MSLTPLKASPAPSIAFDLDGTLVDTAPDLIGTLNVLLREQGLPPLPLDAGAAAGRPRRARA